MICIKCGCQNTRVINSRHNKKSATTWRRRQCKDCGYVYTTYEEPALDQITIVSDSGSTPFSHAKLMISLAGCFEHAPLTRAESAQALAKTVEAKLIQNGFKTSPQAICEASYQTLKNFDRLASVQYAAKHPSKLKRYLR